ncbi:unnamed protein product [Rotaria sp. Silwood1]|nr:unnamed protein product [Rotaria sp. Silwood1]CAF0864092.1 unnamed protein product [Rotaria sp. Silwood1]CAF3383833.1 unnamed protein product [Rotaria sp. Silwood1]CAF4610947.1 unnamed protein product [Rotaria sp. Silwood1]CAF4690586.1 unnamed protein product [Rotaria sp. Silwood1]
MKLKRIVHDKRSSISSSAVGPSSTGRQGLDHKKSVTFDDGIKPGVETAASSAAAVAATNIMSSFKIRNETDTDQVSLFKPETLTTQELEERIRQLKDSNEPPVEFRIHNNLTVISKIVDNFDCYLNRNGGHCWIFSTRGLCTVAQDELIFIFDENIHNANDVISDLLIHIHQIYIDATKGSFVRHLGLSLSSNSTTFLGSSTANGFLYISDPTSLYNLFPEAPYIFGILIHRLELPTAQCFPMRLLLRLSYEYQSYPWPLFSIINRDSMFSDTQHTIMSLLCDFRAFTYVLPTIRGLTISIGIQGSVSIRIPRNRHDDMLKSLEQSSPHALSFGIMNVNRQMHSKHLVTIQNSTDQQYETRICSSLDSNNEQIMIGGNFLVVNASLRSRDSPSSSPLDTQNSGSFSLHNNLNAKVNAIEDGIMLQIDGDALKVLKQCLKERKDYAILAKARSIGVEEQKDSTNEIVIKKSSSEQLVEFLWIDDDNDINRGVRSPIDYFPMDGIRNSRIHYAGQRSSLFRLRWTDLFFIQCHLNNNESFDPTRLADSLAKAFTQALTPFIDMLVEAKYRKLGLRVTIDRENASYLAGSNGEQLSAFFLSQLDDHMIPIVMKASDNVSRTAPSLVLELIFYLLD